MNRQMVEIGSLNKAKWFKQQLKVVNKWLRHLSKSRGDPVTIFGFDIITQKPLELSGYNIYVGICVVFVKRHQMIFTSNC